MPRDELLLGSNHEQTRPLRRCAIYTRQSRDSRRAWSSCSAQREACEEFSQSRESLGWRVQAERYDDPRGSSEALDRPGLAKLIGDILNRQIDVVVIYRLDRLSRRLLDFARLMQFFAEHGVELAIVTHQQSGGIASSGLFLNLAMAFAEFEQTMIRDRMTESRAALKRRGRRVAGPVPYGYRADSRTKQLVIEPAASCRVKTIFELAATGRRPSEISRIANEKGWRIETRKHGQIQTTMWTPRQVLSLLANPVYVGLIKDGESTRPGIHEPIVERAVFDAAAEQTVARRSRDPGRTEPRFPWPLRGLLKCGQCGRLLTPSISGYRNVRYRYYRCRSHAGGKAPCRGVAVSAHEIEQFVRRSVDQPELRATMDQFCESWSNLEEGTQLLALRDVLQEVVFDPDDGTVSLTFVQDPLAALNRDQSASQRDWISQIEIGRNECPDDPRDD